MEVSLHVSIYPHIYVHTITLLCPDGRAHRDAFFGTGSGPIFLSNVQCTSKSSRLLECSSRPILSHTWQCFHHNDAGASCEGVFVCSMYIHTFFEINKKFNKQHNKEV